MKLDNRHKEAEAAVVAVLTAVRVHHKPEVDLVVGMKVVIDHLRPQLGCACVGKPHALAQMPELERTLV